MALQSSGAITLEEVQAEFGGTNPIGMNEYYSGGDYVPATSANSSIPSSGAIAFSNFYNGSALPEITFSGFQAGTSGSFDIGAESSDRLVIVVAGWNIKNGGSLATATVNGVSCTVNNGSNGVGAWEQAGIAYANVPSGTGSVSVSTTWNKNGETYGSSIGIYVVRGLASLTPVAFYSTQGTFTSEVGDIFVGMAVGSTTGITQGWSVEGLVSGDTHLVSGTYYSSACVHYQATDTSTVMSCAGSLENPVIQFR